MNDIQDPYEDNGIDGVLEQSDVEIGRLGALSADLYSYAVAIESLGVIDRATAISVESMDSTALNTERYPISGYTIAPSKTNYKVTLEGIGDSLLRISKKIIEAIVNLLKKVYEFFRKLAAYFGSHERKRATMEEEIIAVKKATTYILQNAPVEKRAAIEKAIHDSKSELDTVLADDIKKANRELLHSLLSNDRVHRAYTAFGKHYIDFLITIIERVVTVEADIVVVGKDNDKTSIVNAEIEKELATNRYTNYELNNALRSLKLIGANVATPHEFADAIARLRYMVDDLFAQPSTHPITLETILRSDVRNTFIVSLDSLTAYYGRVEQQISKLDGLTQRSMPTSVHSWIIKLATLIRLEYHAATHFLRMSVHYSTMASEATRLELRAALYTESQARKARANNPK